jgi:methylmalonyl-CoA mutase cobalamin-binding subunit
MYARRQVDAHDRNAQYNKVVEHLAMKMCFGSGKQGEESIQSACSQFVADWADYVIDGLASEGTHVKDALSKIVSTIPKAEFLIAAHANSGIKGSISALANAGFIEGINSLEPMVAGSLLYEIGITQKFKELTDQKIFSQHALDFLNALDHESASGWFASIAATGNVEVLTSKKAMSNAVLDFIKGIRSVSGIGDMKGKIAGDLSFIMGDTGKVDALADAGFLQRLSEMPAAVASRYISALLITNGEEYLTTSSVMNGIRTEKDIAMITGTINPGAPVILMSNPGETHDRSLLIKIRDLVANGFNVVYTGELSDPAEVARLAMRYNAQAFGIGLRTDIVSQRVENIAFVTDTIKHMRIQGSPNMITFAGGTIDAGTAATLERQGIRVLGTSKIPISVAAKYSTESLSSEIISLINSALGKSHVEIRYHDRKESRAATQQTCIAVGAQASRTSDSYSVSGTLAQSGSAGVGEFDYEKNFTVYHIGTFTESGRKAICYSDAGRSYIQKGVAEVPRISGNTVAADLKSIKSHGTLTFGAQMIYSTDDNKVNSLHLQQNSQGTFSLSYGLAPALQVAEPASLLREMTGRTAVSLAETTVIEDTHTQGYRSHIGAASRLEMKQVVTHLGIDVLLQSLIDENKQLRAALDSADDSTVLHLGTYVSATGHTEGRTLELASALRVDARVDNKEWRTTSYPAGTKFIGGIAEVPGAPLPITVPGMPELCSFTLPVAMGMSLDVGKADIKNGKVLLQQPRKLPMLVCFCSCHLNGK